MATMVELRLKKEFDYFLAHQKELSQSYSGRYVVIKGEEVIGVYDTMIQAFSDTSKTEKPGTFLIQLAEPGEESYTQVFHSRVHL